MVFKKDHYLMGSAGCVVVAAIFGVFGLTGAAFSVGLASMGLFFIAAQLRG